jgi:long-chain fatty acid transport protein
MGKRLIGLGIVVLILGLALPLYAGGIINKQNQSAEYIRTLSRNAATDAADAVVYNPAGVMRMQNGFYVKADVIYLEKEYSNDMPTSPSYFNLGTLESDEPSLVPGLFLLYKQDKWAGFFAVTIPGGGGKVEYDDGNARTAVLSALFGAYIGASPLTADQYLEAESVYTGYTLGGAFKISDSLSLSGGVRYVDAFQNFKGKAVGANPAHDTIYVDIDRTADGWNYFLGMNYAPNEVLNIGFLYMSNTRLNFKADTTDTSPNDAVSNGVGWADGTHEREDLPGYLAVGVSYFIIPNKLRTELSLTYYLETDATFDAERFDGAGNSYDLGVALEYIFNPQWKVSMGYMHTNIRGMSEDDLLTEAPELDANTIGLGCVWSPLDRLSITLGGIRVWYDSETKEVTDSRGPTGTELDKDVWGLSFGVQYRFL